MKLMFDANLSRKLAAMLADVFPESGHVSLLGREPEDIAIWNFAKANGFTIVSKDSDFYRMSVAWGGRRPRSFGSGLAMDRPELPSRF